MSIRITDDSARESAGLVSISRVLLAGLLLSSSVMVVGLIAAAVSGRAADTVLPLDQVLRGIARGNANAILDLGILLLFATPLAGIVSAFAVFWGLRDRAFVLIAGTLLLMFIVVFAIALH